MKLLNIIFVVICLSVGAHAQIISGGLGNTPVFGAGTPFSFEISTDGTTTIAKNPSGTIVYSGTDAGPVFRSVWTAIAAQGDSAGCVGVRRGIYSINTLATESGGGLGYKYAIGGVNSGGSIGEQCWKGEDPLATYAYVTPAAIATTTTEYVIGLWGGYTATAAGSRLQEVRLSDFSIQFPNGNETRGNTCAVDLRFDNIVEAKNMYLRNARVDNGSGPSTLPVKGSIDSCGLRGPDFQGGGGTFTDIQSLGFYNAFELSEIITGRKLQAANCTYAAQFGYDDGSGGLWGAPVNLDLFAENFCANGIQIGTHLDSNDHSASLVITNETIEQPAGNTGNFARVSMATDNSDTVTGHISYTIIFNGGSTSPNYNYWALGGQGFEMDYYNNDKALKVINGKLPLYIGGSTSGSTQLKTQAAASGVVTLPSVTGLIPAISGSITTGHCIQASGTAGLYVDAACSGGGGTLSFSGGTTTGHCVQVGSSANTLVDSGSTSCGGGGGGLSQDEVRVWRSTSQTFTTSVSSTAAVSFDQAIDANAGMWAIGTPTHIVIPNTSVCTLTAGANVSADVAYTEYAIYFKLNGTTILGPFTDINQGSSAVLGGLILAAPVVRHFTATDYVEVIIQMFGPAGTATIVSATEYSPVVAVSCLH